VPEHIPRESYRDKQLRIVANDINKLEDQVRVLQEQFEEKVQGLRKEIANKEEELAEARGTHVLLKTGKVQEVPPHPLTKDSGMAAAIRPSREKQHTTQEYLDAIHEIEYGVEFTAADIAGLVGSTSAAAREALKKYLEKEIRVTRPSEIQKGAEGGRTRTYYQRLNPPAPERGRT
jgi:hypothetical protein